MLSVEGTSLGEGLREGKTREITVEVLCAEGARRIARGDKPEYDNRCSGQTAMKKKTGICGIQDRMEDIQWLRIK